MLFYVINCINKLELNDTSMSCITVDLSEVGMYVETYMELLLSTVLCVASGSLVHALLA